jgi:hypothetical protein
VPETACRWSRRETAWAILTAERAAETTSLATGRRDRAMQKLGERIGLNK